MEQEYNERLDNTKTEADMQNLGDLFKTEIKGSKIKTKLDNIKEKVELAKPLLKEFKSSDTKLETLKKVKPLLEVFYSPKKVEEMILDFEDPRRHKLDTDYLIHRMYSAVAFRLDQIEELERELEEELN